MPPPPVNPNHHPHAMPARDAERALLFGIPLAPGVSGVDFVSFLRKGSSDPWLGLADVCQRKSVMIWETKTADIARVWIRDEPHGRKVRKGCSC